MKIANFIYSLLIIINLLLNNINSKATAKIIDLLQRMIIQKYIGGKHTPEKNILKNKIAYLTRKERKEFELIYTQLINEEIIIRKKKMTKKSTDWHISLNPKKTKIVKEIIDNVWSIL